MHMSFNEVLWPNIFFLTFIGIWTTPSKVRAIFRFLTYLRVVVHFSSVCMLIGPILYTFYKTWGNVAILAEYGGVMFVYILIIFKLAYVILRRHACHRIYEQLKDFWESNDNADERRSFEDYAFMARTFTVACVIAGSGNIFMFVIPPAVGDFIYRFAGNRTHMRRILPLDILYGFDYQCSPIFEMMFSLQSFGLVCAITVVLGNDCTLMAAILHTAGQFKLISTRLRGIVSLAYLKKFRQIDKKHVVMEIQRCISHHQRVIRVSEELSELAGPMVFAQILMSGLVVCMCGFCMIKANSAMTEMIKFVVLFICIMMQLIMWCWPGELLIHESSLIAKTIFSEMPWFSFPIAVQRDLHFVMLRAQKECKVVGVLQIMCLRKLTEVFNTAISYVALLRNFQN